MSVAVLIDFPNIYLGLQYNYLNPPELEFVADAINKHASKFGEIVIKQVYGDWNDSRLFGLAQPFTRKGFKPVQVTRKNNKKDRTDLTLSLDALQICYTASHVNWFCFGSGDADYVDVIERIKAHPGEKKVTSFSVEKTTSPDLLNFVIPEYIENYCEEKGHKLVDTYRVMSLLFNMSSFSKEKGLFLGAGIFRKALVERGLCSEENSSIALARLFADEVIVPAYRENPKNKDYKTKEILINANSKIIKNYCEKFEINIDSLITTSL